MVTCRDVTLELEQYGLLLMQDARIRSVVGILAGGALKGSWWSHPASHAMFHCLEQVGDSPDVLTCRLVARKVTFLHRALWPPFLTVATSGEDWQTRGLSKPAQMLLGSVQSEGLVTAKGPAARELQERLLVAAEEIHTESGRHELRLETWERWAASRHAGARMPLAAAKESLERQAIAIGATAAALPWNRRTTKRGRS
jgi:hypothetical protein